jgi:hypothetical protein
LSDKLPPTCWLAFLLNSPSVLFCSAALFAKLKFDIAKLCLLHVLKVLSTGTVTYWCEPTETTSDEWSQNSGSSTIRKNVSSGRLISDWRPSAHGGKIPQICQFISTGLLVSSRVELCGASQLATLLSCARKWTFFMHYKRFQFSRGHEYNRLVMPLIPW